MVLWLAVAGSLVVAVAAWVRARRVARQLDELAAKYWELRYQYSELRTRLDETAPARTTPQAAPADGLIPIASLKR